MESDVIIIGGGLVGMSLALALDAHGLSNAVVDAADLTTTLAPGYDGRASAIASASARMLRAIGLGDILDDHACAIHQIRVTDTLSPLHLHFDGRVDGSEDDPLGFMLENRVLRTALLSAAGGAQHLALHAPARITHIERGEAGATVTLDSGKVLRAPLVIAADGRRSRVRDDAGIRVSRWSYPHTALVTMIAHERPHNGIAFELFYPAGPFAILPMPGDGAWPNRSAIVWSVARADAPGYLKLGPRALAAEITAITGGFLGAVDVIAPTSSFPLEFHHAETYVAQRLAIIGDAAHGMHPIAGQGLNLGLRDVAAMTQVLVESARLGLDLGAPAVLDRYEAWRRLDASMVLGVTDALNRLFAVKGRLPAAVRRLGLAAVERIAPLKAQLMAEARGETGDRPALLRGELV
jgi:2-octaprenyl-6-methoxyphenol hydroxylase